MSFLLKKAALKIYALNTKDRRWVLGSMPEIYRIELENMLFELQQMRLPDNVDWLSIIGSNNDETVVIAARRDENTDFIEIIDQLDQNEIRKILKDSPDAVLSAVLSIHEWSWKIPFLSKIRTHRRKIIIDEERRLLNTLSNRVSTILLNSIVEKIPAKLLISKLASSDFLQEDKSISQAFEINWGSL